ncbi:LysM peptidoglycan-binding domain-containing protein [Lysinibacillus yapensis]|uniref:LysM peptidoglycan-binding domain-containing protein n=1 Tax=Ureibacillus yapensis TaxID=2304605 RepID=A0A396S5D1_9BACL|nr:LysM peptidoglycan-binding domain-containing protein [Lysinibacillus yapensis]RHW33968.1 LysM peptidoglycan-binding domain-containing protein [Lysinibacillus yapensis]
MFKKVISIVPVAVLAAGIGANAQASTITVEKGDTLWGISREHNVTVENIQTWNHLSSDTIHAGDVLTLNPQNQYTVKKGDTLWSIAQKYNVTVSQIKNWNQLQSELIQPGLTLTLYNNGKTVVAAAPAQNTPAPQPTASSQESSQKAVSQQSAPKKAVAGVSTTRASESAAQTAPSTSTNSKELIMQATAYTASCEGCSGVTATGINLKQNPNAKVISVDPSVIPLGSKVYVEGYGEAIAGDTGSAIKGNKIDVFIPSKQAAINYGVKQVKVTILN